MQYLVVGRVRQGDEDRDEAMVIASDRHDVERYTEALDAVRLKPVAVETSTIALARLAMLNPAVCGDDDKPTLITHLADSHSEVVMIQGRTVRLIKTVDIGRQRLIDAVAAELDCTPAMARRYLNADDPGAGPSGPKAPSRERLAEIIAPELTLLAREVALCIRYVNVTYRGPRPQHAWVVAEPAMAQPLFPALLQEAAVTAAPLPTPLDGRVEQPHLWAVACGAALRGYEGTWTQPQPQTLPQTQQPQAQQPQPLAA